MQTRARLGVLPRHHNAGVGPRPRVLERRPSAFTEPTHFKGGRTSTEFCKVPRLLSDSGSICGKPAACQAPGS